MILAILASLVFWPAYIALSLVLDIVGIVILLPLSYFTKQYVYRPSKIYPPNFKGDGMQLVDAWPGGWLTWLWGNEEDGITGPPWWLLRNGGWRLWRKTYVWSALRNPSNNLRYVPVINPVIDPKRVRSRGGFVWQGPYAGYVCYPKFRGITFRFWIGWKLKAEDVNGVADNDMRKPRCGFALQFKRND